MHAALDHALAELPLVAILRGVTPQAVLPVADALLAEGFRLIEVPLNSPEPWASLERLAAHCPEGVLAGAGTVLTADDARRLAATGCRLLVTPNTDAEVIAAARAEGLATLIGCMTPTEALAATASGADALKLFPAASLGPGYLRDLRAVLPPALPVLAVGGIDAGNLRDFHAAGARGFGLGSNLYKPGRPPDEVRARARDLVAAWRALPPG